MKRRGKAMKYVYVIWILFLIIQKVGNLSGREKEEILPKKFSKALMYEYEKGQYSVIVKKTSALRAVNSFSIKRIYEDGEIFYKFTQKGSGDYDKYEDVFWEVEAKIKEKKGFLYPIYTIHTIRDKKNNDIIVKYEKHYNYKKKRVYYLATNNEGKVLKKRVFPIKGKTVDDFTMVYFLRSFISHLDEEGYRSFYLLTSEPRLYKIDIKVIGKENVKLPIGKREAIKIRIIPNLGLLTGIAKALVPPTYLWFEKKTPHIWLKYEGLESGLGSAHVILYLTKFDSF